MGVVKRQGIKQSIVTYIGVVLGMVNVLFIYPAFLREAEIGIINYVREIAAMLSLFVFLGSTELIIRFFPYFRDDEKKHNGFLFLLLAITGTGCLLLLAAFLIFKEQFYTYFSDKEDPGLYLQFIAFIPAFTVLISFGNLFLLYASNFQRIVIPAAFNEFLPKIGLPLLVIAYFLKLIPFNLIFWGSLAIYAAMMIGQIWYVRHLGHFHIRPDFTLLKKPMVKEMAHYSLYGFVGGIGSRFSSEFVNIFMVGTLSTLTNTGIYAIAYFISNVVDVPKKAISRIVSPLLADKWKEGKLGEIAELYHKTSLNQLIVGLWLFLAIWVSIDQLFEIMPNGESFISGKYVVFILGLARIVDMVTGTNSEIISFSKYYRYNFFLILFMAVIHITANLLLIKQFGLVGVAMATLISLTLFNLAKLILIQWKMGMQPFTRQTAVTFLLAGVAFGAVHFIPSTGIPFFDVAIRSGGLTLVFFALIWYFKVSPDVNSLMEKGLAAARHFHKRR
ncbi:MAG: polysaccharide biosynthesis C-terminal domain-containing protein [Saprospiraceae bacterium]